MLVNYKIQGLEQSSTTASLCSHEEGDSGQDPLYHKFVLFGLHLQVSGEGVGTTSCACDVNWALVEADFAVLLSGDSGNEHDWKLWMEILQDHIGEVTLLTASAKLPSGAFEEESMDVSTVLCDLRNLFWISDVGDIGLEGHVIKGEALLSGCDLHDGSQEGHWVEQTRDPEGLWLNEFLAVFIELEHSQEEVVPPSKKVFQGEVGIFNPWSWLCVDEEGSGQVFHVLSDVQSTTETGSKIFKRFSDGEGKQVHSLAFLKADNDIW